jgi:hypothetical protein
MQILTIAVYAKSGAIQRWNFRLGSVNIITGSRRTGKTALLQIVEYCLGRGECDVPQGVIRSSVEWYAVLLQIGDTQVFIARRNPLGDAASSSEVFVEIGASLEITPMEQLRRTSDPDGLTATLGDLVGIGENLFTPPEGTTRLPLEANFKHCWPFLFQRQDEVASPSFLFHREKENSFIQQSIKDTLPYFMGVVKENRLLKQEELRRLRAEAQRLRRRLEESQWLRNEALARGKSLVAAAQELGIYSNSEIPEEQDLVVRTLKQIASWKSDAPEEAPGLALIADTYDWTELYHIHCVVRSFYTCAAFEDRVYGSIVVCPASDVESGDQFDFANHFAAASIMMRIGDVMVLAVMNDSGVVLGSMMEILDKITGPLTRLQGRELLAKICHWNLSFEPRPEYVSNIDLSTGKYVIEAVLPEGVTLFKEPRVELYGKILHFFVREILERTGTDPEIIQHTREGRYSFLFKDDGGFLTH